MGARWRWISAKTADCVALDATVYPFVPFDRWQIPWPVWACKGPDGGVHIDARVGRIDIRVAEPPNDQFEINWTCDFSVKVVARRWLSEIQDLVDGQHVFAGRVFLGAVGLEEWATLTAIQPPTLYGSEGRFKQCAICGATHTVLWGKLFFCGSETSGRRLIVNEHGIFVHEAEWTSREIRVPEGAFRPTWVPERVRIGAAKDRPPATYIGD